MDTASHKSKKFRKVILGVAMISRRKCNPLEGQRLVVWYDNGESVWMFFSDCFSFSVKMGSNIISLNGDVGDSGEKM